MTANGGENDRSIGVSRRRLLAGLGGVGAIGMGSGAGAFAYFSADETFADNDVGSGNVELLVNEDPVPSGAITVSPDALDRGESDYERLVISVRDNASRLWLAAECPTPTPSPDLADELEVNVRVDGDSATHGWRTLAAALLELVDGHRIDDGCLAPSDSIELEIAWRLPEDVDDDLAGTSTPFTLRLYAEQCRHVSETVAEHSNPFAGRDCKTPDVPDEPGACPRCDEFGKADGIDGSIGVDDVVELVELPSDVGSHSIVVTDVEDEDGEAVGVAFDLVDGEGNPGPDVCAVRVKGGRCTETTPIDPPSPSTGIVYAPYRSADCPPPGRAPGTPGNAPESGPGRGRGNDPDGGPGTGPDPVDDDSSRHGISHIEIDVCLPEAVDEMDGADETERDGADETKGDDGASEADETGEPHETTDIGGPDDAADGDGSNESVDDDEQEDDAEDVGDDEEEQ